jgi:hypothetical protein
MSASRTKRPLVRVREVLPVQPGLPVDPPKLEHEQPHRRLARLTREHAETTTALQELKREKAERSIKAQQCRQTISTAENTHFENQRRELSARLLDIQTQIGATNKELRERKAAGHGNGSKPAAPPKTRPLATDLEFDVYFRLAAHSELAPALYAQVERVAKSLLNDARRMGVES